jgi:hypothetical protein
MMDIRDVNFFIFLDKYQRLAENYILHFQVRSLYMEIADSSKRMVLTD